MYQALRLFVLTLIPFASGTKAAKPLWSFNHGTFDAYVWNSSAGAARLSRGTSRVPSRIFDKSLLCHFVFFVPIDHGGIYHCPSNPCPGVDYVFLD